MQSITIDSLCLSYVKDTSAKVVIKLDVEGAELPALVGAKRLLQERETLVVYEENLEDPESKASDYVLKDLGYEVYYCTEKYRIVRMAALSDIQDIKARTTINWNTNCNFFACSPTSTFSQMFDEMTYKGSNHLC
ncbi:MAG: FkbM family methyltransferase [Candidatus Acidiferrales bacterium]